MRSLKFASLHLTSIASERRPVLGPVASVSQWLGVTVYHVGDKRSGPCSRKRAGRRLHDRTYRWTRSTCHGEHELYASGEPSHEHRTSRAQVPIRDDTRLMRLLMARSSPSQRTRVCFLPNTPRLMNYLLPTPSIEERLSMHHRTRPAILLRVTPHLMSCPAPPRA
jgi:hypothetical protein